MSDVYRKVFDARFKTPMSMLVAGCSQSGKSTFVGEFLEHQDRLLDKEFTKIIWCYGEKTDDMERLKARWGDRLVLIKGLPADVKDYVDQENSLVVFDDLFQECNSSECIKDLFCKECHHRKISCILVTQNLFGVGKHRKDILRNCTHLVLFNNPLDNRVPLILAQQIQPRKQKAFLDVFHKAAKETKFGYLLIDGAQTTWEPSRLRTDIFGPVQKTYIIR